MSKPYNTYDELRQSKLRTLLLLLLLLNTAFSLFYVVSAINNSRQPSAVSRQPSAVSRQPSAVSRQPSAIIVAGLSLTVLVISLFRMCNYAVLLNYLAIIIGLSWAWHILFRFNQLATPDKTFFL
ncbi:MAG: hypothetical protein ACR5LG_15035 [Sodalis sp. (in: enterobacteria)]|uniref:hypothetical protein n=1 Tax=Sodalis sp. (in: enterobacteria) TaxID=1898979 RepID=UPI003F320456